MKGTASIIFLIHSNSSARASTEDNDAIKVIGIVHSKHSATVADKLSSRPTSRSLCVLPTFIQKTINNNNWKDDVLVNA